MVPCMHKTVENGPVWTAHHPCMTLWFIMFFSVHSTNDTATLILLVVRKKTTSTENGIYQNAILVYIRE